MHLDYSCLFPLIPHRNCPVSLLPDPILAAYNSKDAVFATNEHEQEYTNSLSNPNTRPTSVQTWCFPGGRQNPIFPWTLTVSSASLLFGQNKTDTCHNIWNTILEQIGQSVPERKIKTVFKECWSIYTTLKCLNYVLLFSKYLKGLIFGMVFIHP